MTVPFMFLILLIAHGSIDTSTCPVTNATDGYDEVYPTISIPSFYDPSGGIVPGLTAENEHQCAKMCWGLGSMCEHIAFHAQTKACQLLGGEQSSFVREGSAKEWWTALVPTSSVSDECRRGGLCNKPLMSSNNAFLNSISDKCEVAKQLYPKRGCQWPRYRSGSIPNTCEFDCMDTVHAGDINVANCSWQCGSDLSRDHGVSWIGQSPMTYNVSCDSSPDIQKDDPRFVTISLVMSRFNQVYREDPKVNIDAISGEEREFIINISMASCESNIPILQKEPQSGTVDSDLSELGAEAYRMTFIPQGRTLNIISNTIFGAYHALTSFELMIDGMSINRFNLLNYDQGFATASIANAIHLYQGNDIVYGLPYGSFDIIDWPKYPIRGIVIDSGKQFWTTDDLKTIIDHISTAKMNTLQWKFSSNQTFSFALGTRETCVQNSGSLSCTFAADNDVPVVIDDIEINPTDYIHGVNCNFGNCAAAMGTGAVYNLDDIAVVLAHAWLNGVSIIFEVGGPSDARSWGSSELDFCHQNSWYGDRPSSEIYSCPNNQSLFTLMCAGSPHQKPAYCDLPPCGDLNIAVGPDGEFVAPQPTAIFRSIVDRLVYKVDWTTASMKFNNLFSDDPTWKDIDFGAIFTKSDGSTVAYVNSDDLIHVGIDSMKSECLGNEGTQVGYRKWVVMAVEYVLGKGLWPIGWSDGLITLDESTLDLLPDIIPQVKNIDDDSQYSLTRGLFRKYNTYIWSFTNTMRLDCGHGNSITAGLTSDCEPFKTFWDVYNIDPDNYDDMILPMTTNPSLNSLGGIALLSSEGLMLDSYLSTISPRLAAVGAGLWTGRDDRPNHVSTLGFENNFVDTFDYTSINSQDFKDILEWQKWGFFMAHLCYVVTPGRTMFCFFQGTYGHVMCTLFSKSVYDQLWLADYQSKLLD
eukprot:GHVH01012082.1.p1 GENE.GHVH01012082.1~~GHVH01012082.1.p1  ORF type:complete len:920 (+),score=99.18 GHVH01012082.1:45-2804(+)